MNWPILLMLLLSVSMSAFGQVLMKTGLPSSTRLITDAGLFYDIARLLLNPWVIAGLTVYFLAAILWLFVLARSDVSYAYPFVSLGIILTMVLGALLLGEHISPVRVAGTLLIVTGIIFVSQS